MACRITFADDRTTTAKWASVGITAQTFGPITVGDFEVVDLSPDIAVTDNCVRNP
jgi:serine/threonine-protein kinase